MTGIAADANALTLGGLIGYPMLFVGCVLDLFDVTDVTKGAGLIAIAPGGLFELILPIWLLAKGFNSSAQALPSKGDPQVAKSLMPVANALLLGTLMYRSGLVPRVILLFGLIGAPLQLTAVILTRFGVIGRTSTATGILVIPDIIWELSLGIYLEIGCAYGACSCLARVCALVGAVNAKACAR